MIPRTATAVDERAVAAATFFEAEADRLARACYEMARALANGGVLIPFGTGAAATDAAHVAVEFMHPVIVGKRALPAIAPANDPTGASTLARLGRAGDVALALAHGPADAATREFADGARGRGLLTLAFTGAEPATADHAFTVASDDPWIVQEVQETAYHVLWELVHVFFEHPGLLAEACITCGDVAVEATVVTVSGATATIEKGGAREDVAIELVPDVRPGDTLLCHAGVALERVERTADDPSGFLYPFLESEEDDLESVLADVRASTVRKAEDAAALRAAIDLAAIDSCAREVRRRLDAGGRLLTLGNGGSATDAQDMAADALALGWPALSLTNDVATMTAVGNDVGFENVFARQLIPLARATDVAVGISTSGSSANVIAGLDEARRRGAMTIGIAGYDGGRLAELEWLDALFVARSDYIPRLQEAHATIYHLLLATAGSAG